MWVQWVQAAVEAAAWKELRGDRVGGLELALEEL